MPTRKKIKAPTQEEINNGQQEINGKLCQVDWRILQALKAVRVALNRHAGIAAGDLAVLDEAIKRAVALGARVAKVDPPGCVPVDPSTPDQ